MALWGLKAPPLLFCTHFRNCANRACVCVCVFLVAAIPPNELHCSGLPTLAYCSQIKNSITSIPVFLAGVGGTDTRELLMLLIGFCLHLCFSLSLPNISLSFSIATVDCPIAALHQPISDHSYCIDLPITFHSPQLYQPIILSFVTVLINPITSYSTGPMKSILFFPNSTILLLDYVFIRSVLVV